MECLCASNDYYFASINSRGCETCEARCLFCIFNLPPPPPPLPLCPIWPVSERKRERKSTVCLIPSPEEMCVFFFHQTVESTLLAQSKEAHTWAHTRTLFLLMLRTRDMQTHTSAHSLQMAYLITTLRLTLRGAKRGKWSKAEAATTFCCLNIASWNKRGSRQKKTTVTFSGLQFYKWWFKITDFFTLKMIKKIALAITQILGAAWVFAGVASKQKSTSSKNQSSPDIFHYPNLRRKMNEWITDWLTDFLTERMKWIPAFFQFMQQHSSSIGEVDGRQ